MTRVSKFVAVSWSGWASVAVATDDASSTIERTRAAYAAPRSRRDTGSAGVDSSDDTVFATVFVRPDRMRLLCSESFSGSKSRSVPVADGHRVTTSLGDFRGGSTTSVQPSLATGIAGATGMSLGTARTIATLLLPTLRVEGEVSGTSVLALSSPRLLADESVDRVRCRPVTGSGVRHRVDLWIGVEDHLVRRMDTVMQESVFREVHRDIRIDEPIDDTLFSPASVPGT